MPLNAMIQCIIPMSTCGCLDRGSFQARKVFEDVAQNDGSPERGNTCYADI